jgi:hypothetical protein
MNDWNAWEKPLAAWTPRRPSARIKARLFSQPPGRSAAATAPRPQRTPHPAPIWSWLAPATGTLLLLFFTLGQRGVELGPVPQTRPATLLALNLSNQPAAAYLAVDAQSRQNNIVAVHRFGWTSHGRFPSSMPSQLETNNLNR